MLNKDKSDGPKWEDLSAKQTLPRRGIFINIDGPEGSGKSTLALSLAKMGTIAYADIDQSVDRAGRPVMPKGKKFAVRMLPIRYSGGVSDEKVKATCLPAWKKLKNGTIEAAEKWATGGVIVDSGDEAWELLRLGAFGTLTPRGRTDSLYGPVNAEFRNWVRRIHRMHGKHLVFVNKQKEIWKQNKKGESERTGKFERVGFKELGYLADMSLETYREDGEFCVRVKICKLAPNGPAMEGQSFEGEDCDLVHILKVMTDTEESDWIK